MLFYNSSRIIQLLNSLKPREHSSKTKRPLAGGPTDPVAVYGKIAYIVRRCISDGIEIRENVLERIRTEIDVGKLYNVGGRAAIAALWLSAVADPSTAVLFGSSLLLSSTCTGADHKELTEVLVYANKRLSE